MHILYMHIRTYMYSVEVQGGTEGAAATTCCKHPHNEEAGSDYLTHSTPLHRMPLQALHLRLVVKVLNPVYPV